MSRLVAELGNHNTVCRTAQATPDMSIISRKEDILNFITKDDLGVNRVNHPLKLPGPEEVISKQMTKRAVSMAKYLHFSY